ncbi:hypothetical protein [Aneurinibacillus sp. REN35]|uniref:hypothetical protein n=1 Tax=Aneurinibacillus sp. REN35 TaxID=3237286 RepID=UPI003529C38C
MGFIFLIAFGIGLFGLGCLIVGGYLVHRALRKKNWLPCLGTVLLWWIAWECLSFFWEIYIGVRNFTP